MRCISDFYPGDITDAFLSHCGTPTKFALLENPTSVMPRGTLTAAFFSYYGNTFEFALLENPTSGNPPNAIWTP